MRNLTFAEQRETYWIQKRRGRYLSVDGRFCIFFRCKGEYVLMEALEPTRWVKVKEFWTLRQAKKHGWDVTRERERPKNEKVQHSNHC